MRLFFAVSIPDEQIERITDVQQMLRDRIGDDGVRWTRPDQYHYTLKFLGEQSFKRAETAVEVADAIASESGTFDFKLSGMGAFPNSQRPSNIWIGATDGAEQLAALAARIDDVLSRRGFPRERKPVKAHLTLARIKTYAGEQAAARMLRNPEEICFGTFVVDRFVLMRSILSPKGSEYSVLREFSLKQPISV